MNCYFLESTAFAKLFVQEPGTDTLIRLMESVEDNRKLIAASAPLEVYAAIRRRERVGDINSADASAAFEILRIEAARMVQEPLNPAVLEAARQLLDRTKLRWTEALQLGAALVAREMFRGTEIIFVSASPMLLEAARSEGLQTLDPEKDEIEAVEQSVDRTQTLT
ncbi:MAG: type II toxin-antitoxin system VapC family toxin [Terracidiphilus sp.]